MKAVVYEFPRHYRIADVPLPVPGPGELRLEVRQVGVCGTDLHLYEGKFQSRFPLAPGRIRTDGIITHRFGLDDYAQALAAAGAGESAHKVVIIP